MDVATRHNEVEQALVGACLLRPEDVLPIIRAINEPADFTSAVHWWIIQALGTVHLSGEPMTPRRIAETVLAEHPRDQIHIGHGISLEGYCIKLLRQAKEDKLADDATHLATDLRDLARGEPTAPLRLVAPERLPERFSTSAADLDRRHFEPLTYTAPPILLPGLVLLAGAPKVGKSWLALNFAIAVAAGGPVLEGMRAAIGDVLLLALEDTERRLQSRLRQLTGGSPLPPRLRYAVRWPTLDERGAELIAREIRGMERPALIVVDVLARIRGREGRGSVYQDDYATMKPFKLLADHTGCCVLVLHHLSKRPPEDDPFSAVSGTNGIIGAVDTGLILTRDGNGHKLYGRGRDVDQFDYAMKFDGATGLFTLLGDADTTRRSNERAAILKAIAAADPPMLTPAEIADATGQNLTNVRRLLFKMKQAGELEQIERTYVLPPRPGR